LLLISSFPEAEEQNEDSRLANIKSAKKRNRQNEKRRLRNQAVKSSIRSAAKKVIKAVESKDERDPEKIKELYHTYVKTIDNAARKRVVHSNTAARKKSRLAKKVNAALSQ